MNYILKKKLLLSVISRVCTSSLGLNVVLSHVITVPVVQEGPCQKSLIIACLNYSFKLF
jgi:hypothetical protein